MIKITEIDTYSCSETNEPISVINSTIIYRKDPGGFNDPNKPSIYRWD